MSAIIIHPAVEGARARIAALRDDLARVFEERLRLTFDLFPKLRDRYADEFGGLERLIQERTLEMSERRRMVELFALKLDRGQKLDRKMVELVMKAVRNEFARVRARMQQAFSKGERKDLDDAWRPSPFADHGPDGTAPGRRMGEVREIYRHLAKRLHPDAGGDEIPTRRKYWDLVQNAYQRHDLPLLRTLAHLVRTLADPTAEGGTPAAEERRLTEALRAERAHVQSLLHDELYEMREKLDDDHWVDERRYELESELEEVEEEIAKCDRFLAPILSGEKVPPPYIVQNIWSSFVDDMYINNR
ncbi:MAG: hypothetical protein ABI876_01650 [Bacteroidota bacterium]